MTLLVPHKSVSRHHLAYFTFLVIYSTIVDHFLYDENCYQDWAAERCRDEAILTLF